MKRIPCSWLMILIPVLTQITALYIILKALDNGDSQLSGRITGLSLEQRYTPKQTPPRIVVSQHIIEKSVPVKIPVPAYVTEPEKTSPDRNLPEELESLMDHGHVPCFRMVLSMAPESAEASGWLAAALFKGDESGDISRKEIRDLAERAIMAGADFTEIFMILGSYALEDGDRSAAVKNFTSALALNPEDDSLLILFGGDINEIHQVFNSVSGFLSCTSYPAPGCGRNTGIRKGFPLREILQ